MTKSPESAGKDLPIELLKCAREVLANEIAHRGGRREQVFAWASSLLVAIIGGIIFLDRQGQTPLGWLQRGALSAAILILSVHAGCWINYHWRKEELAGSKIKDYNEALAIPPLGIDEASNYKMDWWRSAALAALAIIGLAVVLFPRSLLSFAVASPAVSH